MISVFDMFSVGIGPSSSHTVGPMRAAHAFAHQLSTLSHFDQITHVHIELFGSLGQTGKGHGSGKAVILGLSGYEPESIDVAIIEPLLDSIADQQKLSLAGSQAIHFAQQGAITFHRRKTLAKHANAMTLHAFVNDTCIHSDTYYSIGGGFIVHDDDFQATAQRANEVQTLAHPHPFSSAKELLAQCHEHGISISTLMLKNEMMLRSEADIKKQLAHLWSVMQACIQRGIATEGILPGGLQVTRRAPGLHRRLQHEQTSDPMQAMDWVNLFALAYYDKYIAKVDPETASRYLLTAAAIGILYKKNASISGAEVGCQGEVGVACSMAAGALTAILGGNVNAVENAAEIGMEHNLGLTCDPIGGLVQVPCIERNAMGAIKAINASRLALRGD
jgi:L-serine dehydratase